MIRRRLFRKDNKKKYIFFISIFIFFSISFLIYLTIFSKDKYFEIPEYEGNLYIIPINKGGKEIPNQSKKGLHLSNKKNLENKILNNKDIKFSIQIFTNEDYNMVMKKRDELINMSNSIFLENELFILYLESSIGIEYFLLYKDFNSRIEASNYCGINPYFANNCLVINGQNLD